jgi:hypothetical protein
VPPPTAGAGRATAAEVDAGFDDDGVGDAGFDDDGAGFGATAGRPTDGAFAGTDDETEVWPGGVGGRGGFCNDMTASAR